MAWDDTFIYQVTKVTSAQMNAIIAKIKNILAEDIVFADSAVGDASASKHGYLMKLPGGSAYLRADGQWAAPAGEAGLFTGTCGNYDDRILRADGTGGVTVQGSSVTIDDTGDISTDGGVNIGAGQTYNINGSPLTAADIGAGTGTVTNEEGDLTAEGLVVGNGGNDIKISTDIPAGTTIGTAPIYYQGVGADAPILVTDGGTGITSHPKRTIFLSGAGGIPSITNGCGTFDTFETSTYKQEYRTTTFATNASDISKVWNFILPLNYDGGGFIATPYFHMKAGSTAANSTIEWSIDMSAQTSGERLDIAWGTAQTSITTFAGARSNQVTIGPATASITPDASGEPAVGGMFCSARVTRLSSSTNDDTAYLLGVKLVYTTNGTSDE